jgi:hypothetical protein
MWPGDARSLDGGAGPPSAVLVWGLPALAWLAGCAVQLQMPALWDTAWLLLALAKLSVLVLLAWV